MSEVNDNVNEEVQNEQANTGEEIVIAEGKGKKILKWILGGLALVATAIGGVLLGKGLSDKDEDEAAEAEGPKDE